MGPDEAPPPALTKRGWPVRTIAATAVAAATGIVVGRYVIPVEGDAERQAEAAFDAACPDDDDLVPLSVFLDPDADVETVERLERRLEGDDRIEEMTYLDDEATITEFERLFADSPELVASAASADLPTSFRVEVRRADAEALAADLADDPLVYEAPGPAKFRFCPDS